MRPYLGKTPLKTPKYERLAREIASGATKSAAGRMNGFSHSSVFRICAREDVQRRIAVLRADNAFLAERKQIKREVKGGDTILSPEETKVFLQQRLTLTLQRASEEGDHKEANNAAKLLGLLCGFLPEPGVNVRKNRSNDRKKLKARRDQDTVKEEPVTSNAPPQGDGKVDYDALLELGEDAE